ncbi:MAG: cytochrome b/b6 domain-containing protein [Terracidiphilus sp.]|nr:cytochrome b/b6 domain-containing protein [Terracidiphilus sp.]
MIKPRHSALVRITHWLTVISFAALLVTGAEIVLSHPRFYWGETGNVNMHPLFTLPFASSRGTVPTGYNYVLPDQNGWSRYLHFEAAWLLVLTGAVYVVAGLLSGHFHRNLVPLPGQRSLRACFNRIAQYLRRTPEDPAATGSYNVLQRTAYLAVIFMLFPLIIWTGLALSPVFEGAFPAAVSILGGRQSARTLHFFVTWALVFFLGTHLVMIALSGFWRLTRAMITGHAAPPAATPEDQP